MTFETRELDATRIAIIGGGISGLAAAYLLSPHHSVTLYEAESRLGGHARTITAGLNGDQPVDTGFIVFNYANYPHLTRMFMDLDGPVVRSDMSFGASIDNGRLEYGLKNLAALAAQKRNLMNPRFIGMVRDIFKFNARAEALAKSDDATIGDLVTELDVGNWFEDYYLMPMCGAIWSTPAQEVRGFPARSLVRFFKNHALMSPNGQHQWWTVDGGSVEYVRRLEAHLKTRGVTLKTGHAVKSVNRNGTSATVHGPDGTSNTYDHVIFACHSDQALRLLSRPTREETNTLGHMHYQDNSMVLHRDISQMPNRKAAWSSWVYKADSSPQKASVGVTYWMNRLQNIPDNDPLFVSLNPAKPIPDNLVYDEKNFRHPVFDLAAIKAQSGLKAIQGRNNTWFAGAYTRHGFHEDGFASAVRIARQFDRALV